MKSNPKELRKKLIQNPIYRAMINRIEGDAEMFHRIALQIAIKQQKLHVYSPLILTKD